MRKRLPIVALLGALAAIAAPSAQSSRGLLVGMYDDAQTLGNPDWAFQQYDLFGVKALRVNLEWGGDNGVARRRRPANAVNPADPAYDWTQYDATVPAGHRSSGRVGLERSARGGERSESNEEKQSRACSHGFILPICL